MAVDEALGGEHGSPGTGEAATAHHRFGRHPREDVLDQIVGEGGGRLFRSLIGRRIHGRGGQDEKEAVGGLGIQDGEKEAVGGDQRQQGAAA